MQIDPRQTGTEATRIPNGLRSSLFDDVYYSQDDGLEETRHVFLEGNNLPQAWTGRDRFTVGELGFGSGLNWLAIRQLIENEKNVGRESPLIRYITVEKYPLERSDVLRSAEFWTELATFCHELGDVYDPTPGWNHWEISGGEISLFVGDVRDALATWPESVDVWFLDGFSPAKNPDMWSEEVLASVADWTKPGGTAATFSSAGIVKRNLRSAGFEVERKRGFGKKRHMVVARRAPLYFLQ